MSKYAVIGYTEDGTLSATGPFDTDEAAESWLGGLSEDDGGDYSVTVLDAP